MTLQASGQISFDNINTELQRTSGSQIAFDDFEVRTYLSKKALGAQVSISDLYGTSYVSSNTVIITSNTTYTIPPHISMTVQVWGGGGGYGDPGSGSTASGNYYGFTGGTTTFAAPTNLIAYGGTGGQTAGTSNQGGLADGAGGNGGTATGGDTNTTGTAGVHGYGGGLGGPSFGGAYVGYGTLGYAPGGGGGGAAGNGTGGKFPGTAGGGGGGGYTVKTYSGSNRLTVGSTVAVTIGAGGAASLSQYGGGAAGADGRVIINISGLAVFSTVGSTTWTVPVGITNYKMICIGGAGGGGFVTCPSNAGSMPGGYGGYAESSGTITPGDVISITVGAGGTGPSRNTGNPGSASSISGSGINVTSTGGGGGYFIYGPNVGHAGADGSASGGNLYNGTSQSPTINFSWQSTYSTYGKPNAYGDGTQGVVVIEYY